MAWHSEPVDLDKWTDEYATRRYGQFDTYSRRAWQILLKTAYGYRADGNKDHGERDAAHDSLFNAQPSLTTLHSATWSPDIMRYRAEDLQPALTELLQVSPRLRATETYKYDLVDVARQVLANQSRKMLPQIKAAYDSGDQAAFARLTAHWLRRMQLQDRLLQTNDYFLLGRWLDLVPPWASSSSELEQLNYDARSILTTWGDRKASEFGLHEYANRDWAGLTADYYMPRWKMYFETLSASLATKTPPKPIDWYAFGDAWNRKQTKYASVPAGDSYLAAMAVARDLNLAPSQQKRQTTMPTKSDKNTEKTSTH
jgi:alpha-N-acetylglucosaminidase